MWIARDKSGDLWIYILPPHQVWGERWDLPYLDGNVQLSYRLKSTLFPEITWESEPRWKRFLKKEWRY